MPTYEFDCTHCNHNKTIFRTTFNSEPPKFCPKCNSVNTMKRKFTPVGIIYKCKGFYCTDKND